MFTMDMKIAGFDDELNDAMRKEIKRQEEHVELIASENYASPRVLEAQGSLMTNKYAEGYPGKDIMVVVKTLTLQNNLLLIGLKNYMVQITQMFSHILVRRLMRLFTLLS